MVRPCCFLGFGVADISWRSRDDASLYRLTQRRKGPRAPIYFVRSFVPGDARGRQLLGLFLSKLDSPAGDVTCRSSNAMMIQMSGTRLIKSQSQSISQSLRPRDRRLRAYVLLPLTSVRASATCIARLNPPWFSTLHPQFVPIWTGIG